MTSPDWTRALPDALQEWLEGRRIEEVECIVADFAGVARGKAMPARKFARLDRLFLPTSIFFQTITGEYAELEDEADWSESDMLLTPDFNAAAAMPWASDVGIQVIHDVTNREGQPIGYAPRTVLRRVMQRYAERGWKPVVAPELEFYLTKPNVDPDLPVEPPVGRTGREGVGRQAYSVSAIDEYGPVIDDIYDFAEAQGLEIDTIIQEGGPGQIEVNLHHGDPMELADKVFFFKRAIREAALRNNCFATFMAKPMQDEPGSAMHIHQSVVSTETGRTIFSDERGAPTALFDGFLAGQQNHLPSLLCLLAPYVNSYRRFVAGHSAPVNVEWALDNRSVGLRIPISNPEARRVENRISGMDCNPYLAFAASLASGFIGMTGGETPRAAVTGDAGALPRTLPRDLSSAVDAFCEADAFHDILGKAFCDLYVRIKHAEIDDYLGVISPWEREHLLLNV